MKLALPGWLAATIQVPVNSPATVLPETEQMIGVVLVKLTARPEVAVALAAVVPPTPRVAGLKLMAPMVWLALPTTMFCVTGVAAA